MYGKLGPIAFKEMFRCPINYSIVLNWEILKTALESNAAHVILAHNHSSYNSTPNKEDIEHTQTLKFLLALVTVKVLDHIIVGGSHCYSMVQNGKI